MISLPTVPDLEVELVGETTPPTGGGGGAVVKEGDGVLDDLIRIYSPGVHPNPLEYHVSVTPSSEQYSYTQGTGAVANSLLPILTN